MMRLAHSASINCVVSCLASTIARLLLGSALLLTPFCLASAQTGQAIDEGKEYEIPASEPATNLNPVIRIFGTDVATAGVGGLRNVGSGVISLGGVSGMVTRAYLIWHGVTVNTNPNADAGVTVNGVRITGAAIGTSHDNFWNYSNSQAYRADITSLVSTNPNKTYSLSVFGSGTMNPNGASLIVFFNDANTNNDLDVTLFNGNDSNASNPFDTDGWNAFITSINYTSGTASLQLHVADGQSYTDPAIFLNGIGFIPEGGIFQGNSVPSANTGPNGNGSLWDIKSYNVTSFLRPGANNLQLTSPLAGNPYDALSLVAALVTVPVGSEEVRITNPRISGNLGGTNRNALIGADVSLQATPSPAGLTGGSYSWTITGPNQIVSGGINQAALSLRWTQSGTYTARVNYLRNGVTLTATVTVEVIVPTLTAFSANAVGNVLNRGGGCSLISSGGTTYTMGCFQRGAETGIVWSATAQIPNLTYLSDPDQSGIKFKQAVSLYRKRFNNGRIECRTLRSAENNVASGWGLDSTDPYNHDEHPPRRFSDGLSLQMSDFDAPGLALDGVSTTTGNPFFFDAFFGDDRFETYVYYFTGDPRAPNFEQPLRFTNSSSSVDRIVWNWGGQVFYDPSTPTLYREQFATSRTGPIVANGTNSAVSFQSLITGAIPPYAVCAGAVNTQNPIDGARFFIRQQYLGLLGREPDQGGWDFWTGQITRCAFDTNCIYGASGQRLLVTREFFNAAEFQQSDPAMANPPGTPNFNASVYNPAFVRHCYLGFFNREPDSGGQAFWVDILNRTSDYNGVINAFITSDEYRLRFGAVNPHY